MQDYLSISNALSLTGKDKKIYLFFEKIPGLLSLSTLILAFFGSFFTPVIVGIFIIFFDFYWFLKVVYLCCHQISSFFKLEKNLKENWQEKLKKNFPNWREIYQIICLPFYKEGKEVVEDSIEALLRANYPKEKMIVILAGEERGGERVKKILEEMKQKYQNSFFKFFTFLHPQNLPGEVPGKGANVNYAISQVKKEIERLQIKKENIIFSIFDIDTKPYPDYFLVLTFHYLSFQKPQNCAFQPIPVYNNNVWQVPAFSRVVATSNTFWQMVQQERPEQLVTYSSHSLPFSLFDKIEYPKEVVSDDSRIFWKAFFFFNGNFYVVPLYYPVSMDAVLGKNLISTIVNQYKQQRRWAFGAENIPFLLFNFLKNKKISFWTKIKHSLIALEGFWSWATASLLIFFLGWLPVVVGGEKFKRTLLGFNLPFVTQKIMILAMVGVLVGGIVSLFLLPETKSFKRKCYIFFQWILLPVTLIFFGAIPALDAQVRLLFGKYLSFCPTEKYRKNG